MKKIVDVEELIRMLSVDPTECPGCPEPEFLPDLIRVLEEAPAANYGMNGWCKEIPTEERTEKRTETRACDLISRAEAIDALDVLCQEHRYKIPGKGETYSQYNEAWQDALDRAEGAIFNLPPAQPEQRWIPCSERLPKKPNVYTVTDSNDRVVHFVFTGTDSSREYWKRCAKAWMPLPEPYREDDHD